MVCGLSLNKAITLKKGLWVVKTSTININLQLFVINIITNIKPVKKIPRG